MVRRTRFLIFATLVLAVVALAAPALKSGIDLAAIDRSAKPGDRFFDYANGAWLKATEIPPDRGATGSFYVLIDRTRERVRKLIQEASASSSGARPFSIQMEASIPPWWGNRPSSWLGMPASASRRTGASF